LEDQVGVAGESLHMHLPNSGSYVVGRTIQIMSVFVRMSKMLETHDAILKKLEYMERKEQ